MPRTPFDPLWDTHDVDATAARFAAFRPQVAEDPDLHAQLLSQLARCDSLRGRFAEAHARLDEAEGLLPAGDSVARVRYLLERGRTFNSAGDRSRARPLFEEGYRLALELGETFYAVDAAHMVGIVAPAEEQITWSTRAIAQAEAATDEETRGWLGPLTNNLGWSYHDAGRYKKALETFQKSLAWRQANQPGSREEAIARWTVGRALRSLGRLEDALALQTALERENRAAGVQDGYVYEELGELLLEMGQPVSAAPHFLTAYQLLSQDRWLSEHESSRLARLARLGRPSA